MTATGPEGTAWSCVRGRAAGGEGKGLHQRAVRMEQPAQGSGHGLKLPEFRECHMIFGWSCMDPEVELHDPYGSLSTQDILCILK